LLFQKTNGSTHPTSGHDPRQSLSPDSPVVVDGEPHQSHSPMLTRPSAAGISTSFTSGVAVSTNHVEVELPPESIRPAFVSSYEVSL
jgi:hypothetical protein